MSLRDQLSKFAAFSLLAIAAVVSAHGQSEASKPAEANYEAILHVLVAGSGAAGGDSLPNTLGPVSRQIRSELGVNGLRVINTYYGRVGTSGNFDYKGVSNAYTAESFPGSPSFLDWRLTGLRPQSNAAGQVVHQLQGFRFGARIPVRIGSTADEKATVPINYEAIGMSVDRVGIRENVPTLIGTLTQPKTDGTLFLVLTVRNADRQ